MFLFYFHQSTNNIWHYLICFHFTYCLSLLPEYLPVLLTAKCPDPKQCLAHNKKSINMQQMYMWINEQMKSESRPRPVTKLDTGYGMFMQHHAKKLKNKNKKNLPAHYFSDSHLFLSLKAHAEKSHLPFLPCPLFHGVLTHMQCSLCSSSFVLSETVHSLPSPTLLSTSDLSCQTAT